MGLLQLRKAHYRYLEHLKNKKSTLLCSIAALIVGFDQKICSTCRTLKFFIQGGRYNGVVKKSNGPFPPKHTLQWQKHNDIETFMFPATKYLQFEKYKKCASCSHSVLLKKDGTAYSFVSNIFKVIDWCPSFFICKKYSYLWRFLIITTPLRCYYKSS